MTPTEQKIFDFVKANQPVTTQDLVRAGFNKKTVGNVLSRSSFYKRSSKGITDFSRARMEYWIDDEFAPETPIKRVVKEPITHHPIMQALYWGITA